VYAFGRYTADAACTPGLADPAVAAAVVPAAVWDEP